MSSAYRPVVVARSASLAVALLAAASTPAAADDAEVLAIREIALPGARSITEQIDEKLTGLGEVLDDHLGRLTLDAVELHYDGHRRARVRVGGESELVSLRFDGTIDFGNGLARVHARLHLALGDQELKARIRVPSWATRWRSIRS